VAATWERASEPGKQRCCNDGTTTNDTCGAPNVVRVAVRQTLDNLLEQSQRLVGVERSLLYKVVKQLTVRGVL